jgi:hypothetical protein
LIYLPYGTVEVGSHLDILLVHNGNYTLDPIHFPGTFLRYLYQVHHSHAQCPLFFGCPFLPFMWKELETWEQIILAEVTDILTVTMISSPPLMPRDVVATISLRGRTISLRFQFLHLPYQYLFFLD